MKLDFFIFIVLKTIYIYTATTIYFIILFYLFFDKIL